MIGTREPYLGAGRGGRVNSDGSASTPRENTSNALFARNDIEAAPMIWKFTNVGGIINVKVSLLNHGDPLSSIEIGFKDKIHFPSSSATREPIRYHYSSECSSGRTPILHEATDG